MAISISELSAEVGELKALLDSAREVLIIGHKDADGDTLGCSLAFAEALETQGKQAYVLIPPPLPDLYCWLPGFDRVVEAPPAGVDPALVLFFDAGNMERSGGMASYVGDHATVVNIDHHASNSRFGDLNLIDAESLTQEPASAVGQMCLDLLEHFGWPVTASIATNLYTALMTDTGGFRHENTTPRALADAARLARYGADPGYIAAMVYKSRPLTTLRLQSLSLAAMQVEMEGRLAWAKVSKKMLRETGAVMAESEGIIDTLNSIAGLQVAVVFKEIGAQLTKISVRTRGKVDAAAICAHYGGGGHLRAAGAEVALAMEDAIATVRATATEAIAEHAPRGSKRK
ncbi:MAG TPA: bifunctional oligoribonuclease/PAP phosphatase NrnA [Candidatus Acidoferrales bacterium]|nr:bifunctional oligoribonuclease/PAP phosphatase NrnA [Candidatus Acidoferrales bacterium]